MSMLRDNKNTNAATVSMNYNIINKHFSKYSTPPFKVVLQYGVFYDVISIQETKIHCFNSLLCCLSLKILHFLHIFLQHAPASVNHELSPKDIKLEFFPLQQSLCCLHREHNYTVISNFGALNCVCFIL